MTPSGRAQEKVSVLKLALHDNVVGYLAGYAGGRNILTFAPDYVADTGRPTFTLTTHPDFPKSHALLSESWRRRQRLHPVLSNLLPEGTLREWLAQGLKTHGDNEFPLFAHLGRDLPGALFASAVEVSAIPGYALEARDSVELVPVPRQDAGTHFSLAGVQMKFSMQERDGRYRMTESGALGDWIIKTPSTRHRSVPFNEYTAMTLAGLAGVDIPDIRLVELRDLERLPALNLPEEQHAFAIRRFDRRFDHDRGTRIHTEDFAQVFMQYAHDKYERFNYEQIGRVLYEYTGSSLQNAQQFARRLLVNTLLANGDTHLKNWTLIYPDTVMPELAPAYDIVTTRVYMGDERKFALNLGGSKAWYDQTFRNFESWAKKAGIPWRAIKPQLEDTLDRARTLWPGALRDLPMLDEHKEGLTAHWRALRTDLRITN